MYIYTGTVQSCEKPVCVGGLNFMDRQWNRVLGVYNGSEMRIYINGVQRGTSCPASGNISPNNDGFAIRERGTADNNPFKGIMDDVRVYNRMLSSDEIKQLYQVGL